MSSFSISSVFILGLILVSSILESNSFNFKNGKVVSYQQITFKRIERSFLNQNNQNNQDHIPTMIDNQANKQKFILVDYKDTFIIMYLISAPLGMSLDNYHGLFNVLNYYPNGIPITLKIFDNIILKSALWVPLMFGGAGFLMSWIGLFSDHVMNTVANIRKPKLSKVFNGIGVFASQYYISGLLDYEEYPSIIIHSILSITALLGYYIFDGSKSGFLLAILTSIIGPLTEIVLINYFHLYSYTHADIFGICSWIPWVYFLGASAVLNLARYLQNHND